MEKRTLLLSDTDIKKILTMDETLKAVEDAFMQKGLEKIQMPPKPYLFYPEFNGDLRVMPSYLPELGYSGVKAVNVHPDNPHKNGLTSVMGTIILVDPETGRAVGVFSATWITTIRTGAAGGVASKYLAREDAKVLTLIGAGEQAKTQLSAISKVRKLERVIINDIDTECKAKFIADVKANLGIEVEDIKSLEEACGLADIISTQTPVRKPIIMADWVKEGTHINAIGADAPGKQEIDPKLLLKSRLIIDDWEQSSHSGEINVPYTQGLINRDNVAAEIGHIVAGKSKGRTSEKDITIFDSTGLSLQDVVTAWRVKPIAEAKGVGTYYDFF